MANLLSKLSNNQPTSATIINNNIFLHGNCALSKQYNCRSTKATNGIKPIVFCEAYNIDKNQVT